MSASFDQLIGTPAGFAGSGTSTIIFTTNVIAAVGKRITICFGYFGNDTITSVVDSVGNTYTIDLINGGASQNIVIASAVVTTQLPSGGTITANLTGTSNDWINVHAFTLIDADEVGTTNATPDDDNNMSSTASAANSSDAIIVGVFLMRSGTDFAWTPGGGSTEIAESKGGNNNFASQYLVITANGSYASGGSWSGTDFLDGIAGHVIYKNAGGPPQKLAPIADGAVDGFSPSSGVDLYAMLDEATESAADYVQSISSPDGKKFRIKLAVGNPPPAGTRTIHIHPFKTVAAGEAHTGLVRLYEGGGITFGAGTLIQSFNLGVLDEVNSLIDLVVTNAISAYWDLWLEYEVDVS